MAEREQLRLLKWHWVRGPAAPTTQQLLLKTSSNILQHYPRKTHRPGQTLTDLFADHPSIRVDFISRDVLAQHHTSRKHASHTQIMMETDSLQQPHPPLGPAPVQRPTIRTEWAP